jgi:hypothetical protein
MRLSLSLLINKKRFCPKTEPFNIYLSDNYFLINYLYCILTSAKAEAVAVAKSEIEVVERNVFHIRQYFTLISSFVK